MWADKRPGCCMVTMSSVAPHSAVFWIPAPGQKSWRRQHWLVTERILNTVTLEHNYHSRLRGCPYDILWFSFFNDCRCLYNPLVDNHWSPPAPASATVSKTIHRNILIVLFPRSDVSLRRRQHVSCGQVVTDCCHPGSGDSGMSYECNVSHQDVVIVLYRQAQSKTLVSHFSWWMILTSIRFSSFYPPRDHYLLDIYWLWIFTVKLNILIDPLG